MKNLFKEKFASYPVWILLGDLKKGEEMCREVLGDFLPEEIQHFDTSRDSVKKICGFFLHCPIKTKIAICTISNTSKALTSAFLKKFEDIKPNTKVIILATDVPSTLYSRGMVVKVEEEAADLPTSLTEVKKIPDLTPRNLLLWFNKKLLHFYLEGDVELSKIAYEAREKLVDFYYWSAQGELTPEDAIKHMFYMIDCCGIGKFL